MRGGGGAHADAAGVLGGRAGAVLAHLGVVAAAGCGAVGFVDPDAEARDAYVITAARVVVADDPSLYLVATCRAAEVSHGYHFELDDGRERLRVPDDAVSRVSSSDGRVAWVIALPSQGRAVDQLVLVVPQLEHESRAPLSDHSAAPGSVTARVVGGGRGLDVAVDDALARAVDDLGVTWLRRFDMLATAGPCGEPVAADDPRWIRGRGPVAVLEVALPDVPDPAVCLEIRPAWPRGAPALARRSVAPSAEIERFDHHFSPPVELSPLVWVLVSDLQLPTEAACARNEARLSAAIAAAAAEIGALAETPPGELALPLERLARAEGRPCQQAIDRRLDVDGLLSRISESIDARWGAGASARALVVYANNLDTEPSEGLVSDFDALVTRGTALDGRRQVALFSISPPRGAVGPAVGGVDFAAASEPAFEASLRTALANVWPFRTVVHAPTTRVPLISDSLRDRFRFYRVVFSSPVVHPIGARVDAALAPDADGPAYTVVLPPATLVSTAQFVPPRIDVTWEGCVRFCAQPPQGEVPPASWVAGP